MGEPHKPSQVRLRAGDRELLVPDHRPDVAPAPPPWPSGHPAHRRDEAFPASAAGAVTSPAGTVPSAAGSGPAPGALTAEGPSAAPALGYRPVVALIEAVTAGAEDIASVALEFLTGAGHRCGVVSLDRHNRLAARLGCAAPTPLWCWKHPDPALPLRHGAWLVLPGPASEDELDSADVERMLTRVEEGADAVVVDLGCRWAPRIFRPVLARATHIWIVVRVGQWTAVEVRLEQAEFSGWTALERLRLLVVGEGARVPPDLADLVAGVVPDGRGQAVREFVARELGRRGA